MEVTPPSPPLQPTLVLRRSDAMARSNRTERFQLFLSKEEVQLLDTVAARYGTSKAYVLRIALQQLAAARKIEPMPAPPLEEQ